MFGHGRFYQINEGQNPQIQHSQQATFLQRTPHIIAKYLRHIIPILPTKPGWIQIQQ
jgi:hypothetical protein